MARKADGTKRPQKSIRPGKAKAQKSGKKRSGALGRAMFAILVTLAVLALGFLLVMRNQGTSLAESAVGSIFAPIQNAVNTAVRTVRDVIDGVKDYAYITEEYEVVKQENALLKRQIQAMDADVRENERLGAMLDAKERYESLDPVFAHVIARNPSVWFDTFSINRGTNDGVQVNMTVVTAEGLVGIVYEAGLNYAKVRSIIDTSGRVACLIERTGYQGVMRGQVESNSDTAECNMYWIPKINDIVPGDVVLTSGTDTMFPKGLMVGTVTSVSQRSDLSDRYVVVMPAVDFLRIEEVFVLRTVVESDTAGNLPVLPTPTPKPTPVPTPTPIPADDTDVAADEDVSWQYPLPEGAQPSGQPEGEDAVQTEPTPTFDPSLMPPEDAWAM